MTYYKKRGTQWQHVSYKTGVGCHYGYVASLFPVCAENELPRMENQDAYGRALLLAVTLLCCIKKRSNSCETIKAIPLIYVNYQRSMKTWKGNLHNIQLQHNIHRRAVSSRFRASQPTIGHDNGPLSWHPVLPGQLPPISFLVFQADDFQEIKTIHHARRSAHYSCTLCSQSCVDRVLVSPDAFMQICACSFSLFIQGSDV